MATYKEKSAYCRNCKKNVLARREDTPHTFWLIASILSCGLFAIVWFIHSLMKGSQSFLCPNCGAATHKKNNFPVGNQASLGVLLIVVFIGFIIVVSVLSDKKSTEDSTASPKPQRTIQPASPIKSKEQIVLNSKKEKVKDKTLWVSEFVARKRRQGFTNAECFISNDKMTLTLKTEAVVSVETTRILDKDGYFDEVFEAGFSKLILLDTVGNKVTLTH